MISAWMAYAVLVGVFFRWCGVGAGKPPQGSPVASPLDWVGSMAFGGLWPVWMILRPEPVASIPGPPAAVPFVALEPLYASGGDLLFLADPGHTPLDRLGFRHNRAYGSCPPPSSADPSVEEAVDRGGEGGAGPFSSQRIGARLSWGSSTPRSFSPAGARPLRKVDSI